MFFTSCGERQLKLNFDGSVKLKHTTELQNEWILMVENYKLRNAGLIVFCHDTLTWPTDEKFAV